MKDKTRELEERLNNRAGKSYHFYKPIGQFIDHVDTISFSMDKDGNFHFENVGQVNTPVNKTPEMNSNEKLARVIEECLDLFWGNSAYAVLFCVLRDEYNMIPNKSSFETRIEGLPYTKKRTYRCKPGTITNAFSDNPIYYTSVEKWDELNASKRILLLRDELRKHLQLY